MFTVGPVRSDQDSAREIGRIVADRRRDAIPPPESPSGLTVAVGTAAHGLTLEIETRLVKAAVRPPSIWSRACGWVLWLLRARLGVVMPAKRYSVEQIVAKLREAEKLQGQGLTIPQSCKRLGISEQTFYRWRIKYGALKEDEAQRLKALEQENARLKKIVAEQALDISMLKDLQRGKW